MFISCRLLCIFAYSQIKVLNAVAANETCVPQINLVVFWGGTFEPKSLIKGGTFEPCSTGWETHQMVLVNLLPYSIFTGQSSADGLGRCYLRGHPGGDFAPQQTPLQWLAICRDIPGSRDWTQIRIPGYWKIKSRDFSGLIISNKTMILKIFIQFWTNLFQKILRWIV